MEKMPIYRSDNNTLYQRIFDYIYLVKEDVKNAVGFSTDRNKINSRNNNFTKPRGNVPARIGGKITGSQREHIKKRLADKNFKMPTFH